MRKEVIVYCATNEEDVEVSVQRVADNKDFVLLKIGGIQVAINRNELAEALSTVSFYGQMFDEEKDRQSKAVKLEESRRAAASQQPPQEEDVIIMDVDVRSGPTDSEKKLAEIMKGL